MTSKLNKYPNRRQFMATLTGCAGVLAMSSPVKAESQVGAVTAVTGQAVADRTGHSVPLDVGSGLMVQDLIKTGEESFLAMLLGDATAMRLGAKAELLIDEYLIGVKGTFNLTDGALVFDRPDESVKTVTTIKTVFGQLGVRGTRFFAGPSRGVFGVFVERGELEVTAAGATQVLESGDGIDIRSSGARASGITQWSQDRINEAFASVAPT